VQALAEDWRRADLGHSDRLLCELAERLARDSQSVTAAEIVRLQSAGLSDRAIHDAVQVIAYFSYINRIADALGVEAEPWLEADR
jgi:uncharacterized peroxidase-related enzyme